MITTVYAVVGLACGATALVFAVLGWVLSMPDGVRRHAYRLWTWIFAAGFFASTLLSRHHPGLWRWVLTPITLLIVLSKIERHWRALERARAAERLLTHFTKDHTA